MGLPDSAAGIFGPDEPFFVIAGPCVLEDESLNLQVAETLARIAGDLSLPIIFKASFDKANRSRPDSPRGPGLDEGLERLAKVRRESGLPVLTDIHETEQVEDAAEICDVLQIPASLSRQTDLITAASASGRAVNIKKGQWMAPEDMSGAVAKVRTAGGDRVAVTERGTFFGYGDLVVDVRSFARLRAATGARVVFDGTHSVQRPGRADGSSGGNPEFTPALVRAAVAAGVDGLFLEVHPDPRSAPSDGSNMLRLDRLQNLLRQVLDIRSVLTRHEIALDDVDVSDAPRKMEPARA